MSLNDALEVGSSVMAEVVRSCIPQSPCLHTGIITGHPTGYSNQSHEQLDSAQSQGGQPFDSFYQARLGRSTFSCGMPPTLRPHEPLCPVDPWFLLGRRLCCFTTGCRCGRKVEHILVADLTVVVDLQFQDSVKREKYDEAHVKTMHRGAVRRRVVLDISGGWVPFVGITLAVSRLLQPEKEWLGLVRSMLRRSRSRVP